MILFLTILGAIVAGEILKTGYNLLLARYYASKVDEFYDKLKKELEDFADEQEERHLH